MSDRATLAAYDSAAGVYAQDWLDQPPPTDLHDIFKRYFKPGAATADIGSGSGREVAWLNANGYPAAGFDASEGLLAEARRRYPQFSFAHAELPELSGLAANSFANVVCETVIMHLPADDIAASVRRLIDIVEPDGTLYLSWRVTRDADQRDANGRLYTAFDADLVRNELVRNEFGSASIVFDQEAASASSGKIIHGLVAQKKARL